ncbi:MAG: GNAT family N-acetyltransferase [Lentimicrobium sp.]
MKELTFMKLVSGSHPCFSSCIELYLSAFPPDERREVESLKKLLDNGCFGFHCLISGNDLAGFITIWQFTGFVYVEHFAVFPHLRSSGTGSRAIRMVTENYNTPVILEIERPVTEQAERRLDFYTKNGFRVIKSDYTQPAYGPDKKPVPALLLGNTGLNPDRVQRIVTELYSSVYGIG